MTDSAREKPFSGMTAIITGGCRGIGRAISEKLGRRGADLVLFSSGGEEKYKDVLGSFSDLGIRWKYVRGSIASAEDRERLISEAVAFGGIDVLVNDAGVAPSVRADLLETSEESFDRVTGINTKGTFFLTQAAANVMKNNTPREGIRGRIVNIGSCSAEVSSVNRGEYCISKAGVAMITRLFADRLAPLGITVNEVRPGVIDTDMTSAVREKYDRLIEAGVFPVPRWGTPDDVADAALYFCGCSGYITGSFLDVDGGFHIRRL